jgi:hypothetical protein
MTGHHRRLLATSQADPPRSRSPADSSRPSRASRAVPLRSPRDKPLRSLTHALLDALGYQTRQPHQQDASTSSTRAQKELPAEVHTGGADE